MDIESYLKNPKALLGGLFLVVGAIIFFSIKSCAPPQGSIFFGICNTFLEQQLTFPHTLDHTFVEEYQNAVRIYYKHVDGYGQQNFSYLQCEFVNDQQKGLIAKEIFFKSPVKEITEKYYDKSTKITYYRLKPELLDLFNNSNGAAVIMSQEPDLEIPAPKAIF